MEKIFPVIAAVVGLVVAFCLAAWIKKTDEGTDRMKEIAGYIREGRWHSWRENTKQWSLLLLYCS